MAMQLMMLENARQYPIYIVLVLIVILLTGESLRACESIKLVNGENIQLNNFDTFADTRSEYLRNLRYHVVGDCQQVAISITSPVYKPNAIPVFVLESGSLELYNSRSSEPSDSALVIDHPATNLLVPITYSLWSDKTALPGVVRPKLQVSLSAIDSAGNAFTFTHDLNLHIGVASRLMAGFSGTHVGRYTHHYDLNLGKLTAGKASDLVNVSVQSNVTYDIEITSKNAGHLRLLNSHKVLPSHSIAYSLVLDNKVLDLTKNLARVANSPSSLKNSANTHSLYLTPRGNLASKRAGVYEDLITITIKQKY